MTRLEEQKGTRTQITDLPETNVELSERELRIVSGGQAVYGGIFYPPEPLRWQYPPELGYQQYLLYPPDPI